MVNFFTALVATAATAGLVSAGTIDAGRHDVRGGEVKLDGAKHDAMPTIQPDTRNYRPSQKDFSHWPRSEHWDKQVNESREYVKKNPRPPYDPIKWAKEGGWEAYEARHPDHAQAVEDQKDMPAIMFDQFDEDDDEKLSYGEFHKYTSRMEKYSTPALRKFNLAWNRANAREIMFSAFDVDNDKYISTQEWMDNLEDILAPHRSRHIKHLPDESDDWVPKAHAAEL